jgi:hypothetical protein
MSRAVEKSVLGLMDGTTAEYKSKIRSLFVNLKDKGNPALRASIVDGSLAPDKFAKMTSQVRFLFLSCECYNFNLVLVIGNGFRRETSQG